MGNTKSMTDKYGGEVEAKRIVAESARIVSESPGQLLVQGSIDTLSILDSEEVGDEYKLAAAVSFFKKIFKEEINPQDLKDAKFYIMAEVPASLLQDYIVAAAARNGGTFFEYTDAPVTDNLTNFVPRINIHEEDDD